MINLNDVVSFLHESYPGTFDGFAGFVKAIHDDYILVEVEEEMFHVSRSKVIWCASII